MNHNVPLGHLCPPASPSQTDGWFPAIPRPPSPFLVHPRPLLCENIRTALKLQRTKLGLLGPDAKEKFDGEEYQAIIMALTYLLSYLMSVANVERQHKVAKNQITSACLGFSSFACRNLLEECRKLAVTSPRAEAPSSKNKLFPPLLPSPKMSGTRTPILSPLCQGEINFRRRP